MVVVVLGRLTFKRSSVFLDRVYCRSLLFPYSLSISDNYKGTCLWLMPQLYTFLPI